MNPKNHKERIMRAATDLLFRKGYHAISIGDIARAAKVPKGSLYNHFEGKADLAGQIMDRFAERAIGDLVSNLGPKVESPSRTVDRLIHRITRFFGENGFRFGCPLGGRLNEVADTHPALARRIVGHMDSWAAVLAERFRQWGRRRSRPDVVRSAPRIAKTVQATIQGALLQMKGIRDPAPMKAARHTLKILLESYESARTNGRRRRRR